MWGATKYAGDAHNAAKCTSSDIEYIDVQVASPRSLLTILSREVVEGAVCQQQRVGASPDNPNQGRP